MKEIKRVETAEDAAIVKSQLESSGIDCFLADNEIVSVYPLYSNAIGGIKILVDDANESEARAVLEVAPLQVSEKHCPHCDSQNVRVRRIGIWNGIFIFSGFCIPARETTLYCQDCKSNFHESEMKLVDTATLPDLIDLNEEAESHVLDDHEETELPSYFGILKSGFCSLLVMFVLTPFYYLRNDFLPSEEHYLWGIFVGILIGCLMNYSTQISKTKQGEGDNG